MQRKTIMFVMLSTFLLLITSLIPVVNAYAVIDTLKYDTYDSSYNDMCYHTGNYYVVAYTSTGSDGWLKVVTIDTSGNIGNTVISDYEFESNYAINTQVVKLASNYFAVAYSDSVNIGRITTFYVSDEGGIIQANITCMNFTEISGGIRSIDDFYKIDTDTYAIFYKNLSYYPNITTMDIAVNGAIITYDATLQLSSPAGLFAGGYQYYSSDLLYVDTLNSVFVVAYSYSTGSGTNSLYTNVYSVQINNTGGIWKRDTYNSLIVTIDASPHFQGSSISVMRNLSTSWVVGVSYGYFAKSGGSTYQYIDFSTYEIHNSASNYDVDNDGIISHISLYSESRSTGNNFVFDSIRTDTNKIGFIFYYKQLAYPYTIYDYVYQVQCDSVGVPSSYSSYVFLNDILYYCNLIRVSTNGVYGISFQDATVDSDGFIKTVNGFPSYGEIFDVTTGTTGTTTICEENVFDGLSYFGANTITTGGGQDGNVLVGLDVGGTNAEIETLYRVPFNNAKAKGLDFYVNVGQYAMSPDVGNYALEINGNSFTPCSFIHYSGSVYRLRFVFGIDVYLSGTTIIELNSMIPNSNGVYWYYYAKNIDVDNDGTIEHKYGGYQNGIYDGTVLYTTNWFWGQTTYDFFYRCYYENLTFGGESCGYPNTNITSSKNILTLGDSIQLFYNISSNAYQNILYIYEGENGSIGQEQKYPKVLSGCFGYSSYTPLKVGSYCAVIKRNNVNVSNLFNFTVLSSSDPNHILIFYPEPSYLGDTFNLYYEYLNNGGNNGLIRYGYSVNDSARFIQDNTTGNIYNILGITIGYYYAKMFTEVSSIYYEVQSKTHTILSTIPLTSSVKVSYDTITLTKDNPKKDNFVIGTKGSYGIKGYLSLTANGQTTLLYEISENTIDFTYNIKDISSAGNYYVSLYIKDLNGTKTELANDTFIVVNEGTGGGDGGISGIPDLFDEITKNVIGIGIAMAFLCIPLIIQYKAKIDINIFVYLFFGIFGLLIVTIIGFLNPIYTGIIVFILVLIIVVMWLQRKIV